VPSKAAVLRRAKQGKKRGGEVFQSLKFGFSGVNLSTNVEHYTDVVSVVRYGEELGYDSVWISDRVRDTYVNITACALATTKIRLSPGVINPYTRHPVINARAIATLDELSNGRMAMGIAVGNMVEMTKDLGFETKAGFERVREVAIIARNLFRGETVTYEGKFFQIRNVKLGMKCRPDIPIYIAGSGPKIMEVAGEVGDGAIIPYSDPAVIEHVKKSIRKGMEKAGKDSYSVKLVSWLPTYITNEKQKVVDSLRGYAALMVLLSPLEWVKSIGVTEEDYDVIKRGYAKGAHVDPKLEAEYVKKAKEYVTDDIVQLFTIIGTTQEINGKMEELRKSGFDEFSLWVPSPILVEKRRVLETFANDTMVRFK
jgi:5,10-methylenetetrahydromethanopterin reductase